LEPGLPVIGEEAVSVPARFFKVVAREGREGITVLAFLMENRPSGKSLREYLVPIDRVEALSGIDFFPGLPEAQQQQLESRVQASGWKF
jgi:endonuclease G